MIVYTAQEIRRVEQMAFDNQYTEETLMLRAGMNCAKKIIRAYRMEKQPKRVCVVCGAGNNGGDGFVIARQLYGCGCPVDIVLSRGEPEGAEPARMYRAAREAGIDAYQFDAAASRIAQAELVVDCLYGIGFHGTTQEPDTRLIEQINASGAQIISIDVPSGANATDGRVEGACVRADLTLAITALKYAHILPPANAYCGQVSVVDIGIPRTLLNQVDSQIHTVTKGTVRANFHSRGKNVHKGDCGRLLCICGSSQMPGAAVLSARAAVRSGAGLVTCAVPKAIVPTIASHIPEPVYIPLAENGEYTLSAGGAKKLAEAAVGSDAILIGCGLGRSDDLTILIQEVLQAATCPVVLDADGINAMADHIDVLRASRAPIILTPHPGEMSRLINKSVQYVQDNRIKVARDFAQCANAVVVLKGANTIIASKTCAYVNMTGNPGMAKAGSGDVLAGMMASFLAQGIAPMEAAKSAVYIHGKAGDICAREISQRGMCPSDMLDLLPHLLSQFEN